jgi:hypothetical protein
MTIIDDSLTLNQELHEQKVLLNLKPISIEIALLESKEKMAIVGGVYCYLERANAGESMETHLGHENSTWSVQFVKCVNLLNQLKRRELRILLKDLPWSK